MKRKVIQIAGSTQLVSLPRQWAKSHNVKRGEEIEVQEEGDKIIITANGAPLVERAEINASGLDGMLARCIHALYKRGVDELKINFTKPDVMAKVQEAISKEAVGFEVLEQTQNSCTIRYVSGSLEEFDSVLRRTFLLMLNMSEQAYEALKSLNYDLLKNTAYLEEANNRFTTVCRRHLNKYGNGLNGKVGPMYYIIEELEKIADQYKYICQHFSNLKDAKVKLSAEALAMLATCNKMLRTFYEVFYKFDLAKMAELKTLRNHVISEAHKIFEKRLSHADNWMAHHSVVLSNLIFCLIGPYITAVGVPGGS